VESDPPLLQYALALIAMNNNIIYNVLIVIFFLGISPIGG